MASSHPSLQDRIRQRQSYEATVAILRRHAQPSLPIYARLTIADDPPPLAPHPLVRRAAGRIGSVSADETDTRRGVPRWHPMTDRYGIDHLPNGLICVFDRASKLSGCYYADGTYAHGDLHAADRGDYLASPAVGITPSCCSKPSRSQIVQLSAILPPTT